MSDLISRQAAIEAIKKNTFRLTVAEEQNAEGHVAWNAYVVYSDVAEGSLLELPSVQSETNCSKIPNNSDTISRKAAIDALADMHCKSDEDGYVWIIRIDAWARIDALPSITPKRKTGKWIPSDNGFWACSECKFPSEAHGANIIYNFCPNCGAKMI